MAGINQNAIPESAETPNATTDVNNEARKNELYAHRNRQLRVGRRRMRFQGQGREFESLRVFVTGDEIHHIAVEMKQWKVIQPYLEALSFNG